MNKTPIVEFPVETMSINDVFPIGIPLPWPDKELPNSMFIWVHGQEFDMVTNPKLAKRYPSGRLPDPRWDFFRYVGTDQEALTKQAQSVQPLGFSGVPLPPHTHIFEFYEAANRDPGSLITGWGRQTGGKKSRTMNSTSAGTPAGDITGTGTETKPQCMLWYCIMRIR